MAYTELPATQVFSALDYYDMSVAVAAVAWCALTTERTLPQIIDGIRAIDGNKHLQP